MPALAAALEGHGRREGAAAARAPARPGAIDQPPGLVAFDGDRAVGWVSLGPRTDFERIVRSRVIPTVDDRPVWSIVCFAVSSTARGRGVARALLDAAIAYARERAARTRSRPTRSRSATVRRSTRTRRSPARCRCSSGPGSRSWRIAPPTRRARTSASSSGGSSGRPEIGSVAVRSGAGWNFSRRALPLGVNPGRRRWAARLEDSVKRRIVAVFGATVLILVTANAVVAAGPKSPFTGTWISTDTDGSVAAPQGLGRLEAVGRLPGLLRECLRKQRQRNSALDRQRGRRDRWRHALRVLPDERLRVVLHRRLREPVVLRGATDTLTDPYDVTWYRFP